MALGETMDRKRGQHGHLQWELEVSSTAHIGGYPTYKADNFVFKNLHNNRKNVFTYCDTIFLLYRTTPPTLHLWKYSIPWSNLEMV